MFILGKIDRNYIKEMYPLVFDTREEAKEYQDKMRNQGLYYEVYSVEGKR